MDEGIFSTYRQGENRVTASILAVLRSLSLPRIEHILGALLGEEFTLVSFVNQPGKGGDGVPDAKITAKALLLIETKTQRNALKGQGARDQLQRHLDRLEKEPYGRVLVLTPDSSEPPIIKGFNEKRLVWASFADFNEAINDLLSREKEVVSEREEFLLRELQKMFDADKLLRPAKEVLVIAARIAWPDYQTLHAYVSKANRAFRDVDYIAFYSEGQIQPIVPRILFRDPEVVFKPGHNKGQLGELVERYIQEEDGRPWKTPETATVFLLSAPDDKQQTVTLDHPIENDLPTAFVQGQRYVSLAALRKATRTSELEGND